MRSGNRCGGRLYAMNSILTHGLRQHRVDSGGGWFERLTDAIKGKWPVPNASKGTRRAEHGLGISGRPYYFYALRADRRFGFLVFLLDEIEGADWPLDAKGATPFDSGGMWFGKIATDAPLPQSERRGFFKTYEMPLAAWRSAFETHIGTRYKTIGDYIRGSAAAGTQAQNSGPAIAMDARNEPRAWTWEVRVPHLLVARHLKLRAVCVSEENRNLFLRWLWNDSPLTASERREIDKWIQDYAIVPSPGIFEADRAAEWLVQEVA